jgi:hypothetical protein
MDGLTKVLRLARVETKLNSSDDHARTMNSAWSTTVYDKGASSCLGGRRGGRILLCIIRASRGSLRFCRDSLLHQMNNVIVLNLAVRAKRLCVEESLALEDDSHSR